MWDWVVRAMTSCHLALGSVPVTRVAHWIRVELQRLEGYNRFTEF